MENLLLLKCIFEKEKMLKIGIVIVSDCLLFCVILNLVRTILTISIEGDRYFIVSWGYLYPAVNL